MRKIETLVEAKTYLRGSWKKGVSCPCCGQFVKLYKRKLSSVMSRMLIRLYHLPQGYNHVSKICKDISNTGTHDFSKLTYWGLIQEQVNTDTKKRTSGNWKITEKGCQYVEKRITMPSHVFVYNSKKQGFSETMTTITKSLGVKFNYSELMKTTKEWQN